MVELVRDARLALQVTPSLRQRSSSTSSGISTLAASHARVVHAFDAQEAAEISN
jgi:hypothetical protein